MAAHTRAQRPVIQAPLRQALGPDGELVWLKIPFTTQDLDSWRVKTREYRNDLIGTAIYFWVLVWQHNPDWQDVQLPLEQMTETEKQLILKN